MRATKPAERALSLGSSGAPSPEGETQEESALAVVQELWGLGNGSPLDHLFGSSVIVSLTPTTTFVVLCRRIGERLRRFSEEAKIWIDAFETEPALSLARKTKNAKVKLAHWGAEESLLKKGRYTNCVAFEPGAFAEPETVYGQCAHGLKRGGRIFVADLMSTSADLLRCPDGRVVRPRETHWQAAEAAGLAIERDVDLSSGLQAAIRSGFFQSIQLLAEIRTLSGPRKMQRQAAYLLELETWSFVYAALERGAMTATGFLATRS